VTNQLLLTLVLASMASPALPQAGTANQPKGPQPISRTVYMSRVDSTFGTVDTNKDGFTDRAEIEAAEAKSLSNRKAQLLKQREASFRQMDKDKNGSLSLSEFNSAVAGQSPKADATARLNRLDTNKDGKISAAESRAPAEAQFARLDTNKDGILSVEEQRRPAARNR
jgi:Ca2+-binding EF-hand superfamily protein